MALIACFGALALFASPADTRAEIQYPIILDNSNAFFQQPVGTLAFLPNARSRRNAERATKFAILQTGNLYRIEPGGQQIWFIVNNIGGEPDEKTTTFISVYASKYFKVHTKKAISLKLYRNRNWYRSGDGQFNGVGDFNPKPLLGAAVVEQFFNIPRRTENIAEFDRHFAKWHASPKDTTDDSWSHRERIFSGPPYDNDLLQKFDGRVTRKNSYAIEAYLMRFTISANAPRNSALVFYIARPPLGETAGVYLRTFSPADTSFEKDVFLLIE